MAGLSVIDEGAVMDRRTIVGTLACSLPATPFATVAQQVGKVYRIVHLSGSGQLASKPFIDAFRQGMRVVG